MITIDRPFPHFLSVIDQPQAAGFETALRERMVRIGEALPATVPIGLERSLLQRVRHLRLAYTPTSIIHPVAARLRYRDGGPVDHLLRRADPELGAYKLRTITESRQLTSQDLRDVSRVLAGPGAYRTTECFTSAFENEMRLRYVPPEAIATHVDALLTSFNATTRQSPWLPTMAGIFVDLISIHPFVDGNGRMARALAQTVIGKMMGGRGECWPIGPVMAANRSAVINFTLAWIFDLNPRPALSFFAESLNRLCELWESELHADQANCPD